MNTNPPPGVLNPNVTQTTVKTTIAVSGWTKTIRPPVAFTDNLKLKQMKARKLPGKPSDYEEDHFIPLELGGHPTNLNNLWPQPIVVARHKDGWESYLHKQVITGKMTLAAAQKMIKQPTLWMHPLPKGKGVSGYG